MLREDEDLGGSDRVEPFLYPAPDSGEEGGRANDLVYLSAIRAVERSYTNTFQLTNIRSSVSG